VLGFVAFVRYVPALLDAMSSTTDAEGFRSASRER
jgi:hypothetical protein